MSYVYDSATTTSVAVQVLGDLEDQELLTVAGDADAGPAEQQELDRTAVGEELAAGDFAVKVVDLTDPATDVSGPLLTPRSGGRLVGFELEVTHDGDNTLPPAIALYVDDVQQLVAGPDPFLDPFEPGETRTAWIYFHVANRDLPTELELRSRNGSTDSDVARIDLQ